MGEKNICQGTKTCGHVPGRGTLTGKGEGKGVEEGGMQDKGGSGERKMGQGAGESHFSLTGLLSPLAALA